jgi:short-subunit dehydrogenase
LSTAPRVLVIGATSAIAHALDRRWAARGARLFLAARQAELLEANAADLRVRGAADVRTAVLDANDVAAQRPLVEAAFAAFDGLDIALVAYGTLPDQARAQRSVADTLAAFDTNARSVVAWLTLLADAFERQGAGAIGVVSSPAAERGRASNYVYGSAKAAVSTFAAGLRHRFARTPIRVVTVHPGFVDTPMTAHLQKGALWATPDRVARDIERALDRANGVLHTPWFWRWIMRAVRALPERVFLRTRL